MKAIVTKDLMLLSRESLVRGLVAVTAVLVAVSIFTGLQREQVFDKERSAASVTDRAVWMNQGDRNPHSAAHFSRYAFRPLRPWGCSIQGRRISPASRSGWRHTIRIRRCFAVLRMAGS